MADPGFSPGGAPTPKSAIIFQFFAENCMKMKEFGPGGARVPGAPLGSANAISTRRIVSYANVTKTEKRYRTEQKQHKRFLICLCMSDCKHFQICKTARTFFQTSWRTPAGPLTPLFWTSGDVCPGFLSIQTRVDSLIRVLHRLHAMDSSDSPLVQHLLTSLWPAWQPSHFDPRIMYKYLRDGVQVHLLYLAI